MEIASQQHGIITYRQLRAAGKSKKAIHGAVKRGGLERVHPETYRIAGSSRSRKQDFMASVLSFGYPAWLSHLTAAEIYDLKVWTNDSIEITHQSKYPSAKRYGVTVHISERIDTQDLAIVDNVPVLSVARTLVDLAEVIGRNALAITVDDALQRKIVSFSEVEQSYEFVGRWRGNKLFKPIKEILLDRKETSSVESVLERKIFNMILQAGFPQPQIQYEIRTARGICRVDFAYPDHRVAIEADGFTYHKERSQFDRDRSRENELKLAGWSVYRFTSQTKPWELFETLASAIGTAQTAMSSPYGN